MLMVFPGYFHMQDKDLLAELTADVVSSYISKNKVSIAELPELITSVHNTFDRLAGGQNTAPVIDQTPAVPINRSITEHHLVCLEDGLEFKSLKRHLRSHHNLSPEQYREKWGLPADYPMVTSSYSQKRSKLAKESGLGRAT